MPVPTPSELKVLIDAQVTNKTVPYSILQTEVGGRMKDIVDIAAGSQLASDLTVNVGDDSVGGAVTGDLYHQGDSLESVLRDILIKAIPPVYVPSVAVLSEPTNNPTGTASFEAGTSLSLTLGLVFTKNDAGIEGSRKILKNNAQVATITPFTDNPVTIPDTPIVYKGQVTFIQGACKNNNLGALSCGGRIEAGTIDSNILTYNGYRKAFYGASNTVPVASADVRGLSGSSPNPANGSQIIINIAIGNNKIVFAYPATLQDVTKVEYREFANSDVKGNFTKYLINVAGNNGYAPVSYKVYVYEPVEPFTANATYVVTI